MLAEQIGAPVPAAPLLLAVGVLAGAGFLHFTLAFKHPYTDTVVIRFPDAKAIAGWYGSPAYQALIPIREQAADMVLISYES